MPRTNLYTPIWCKTYYSFLEGASSPKQYVERAAELKLPALALTDRDGVYGLVKGHFAAREHDVRIIAGSQVTVQHNKGSNFGLLLLARDQTGYANLCSLITLGRRRSTKGSSCVSLSECRSRAQGLHAIWLPEATTTVDAESLSPELDAMKYAFSERLSMMLCRHKEPHDQMLEAQTRSLAKHHCIRTVAGTETLYHHIRQRPIQDVLTCIRNHRTVADLGTLAKQNAGHSLMSIEDFSSLFSDDQMSLQRTIEIAEDCTFNLDTIRYSYPTEEIGDGLTASERLRRLTFKGANQRYHGLIPDNVVTQLERELQLISQLEYDGYFLTMYRIVEWCRLQNILCQGRGSAANSAVCYCLGITSIDPVSMNLLFERFLSRERDEPPDIDLDIEHQRREEVIQYVYRTYGRDHTAMVATVIRYRSRSAVRDVGAAFGVPRTDLHRLSKQIHSHGVVCAEDFVRAGVDPSTRINQLLILLANSIIDFPRHLSIHPGGFVFTSGRIQELVPVENATMPGRTVIQWEKGDIEDMKIFKVDLLGLGALTQLHQCFDLVAQLHGHSLGIHSIPKDDPEVFDMLIKAETTGVFQIESRAQMSMLPRLKPRQWYDLVVQIAIVRPGPISGGMVHPYLQRRAGKESVTYPHPCLIPVLNKTLGIPIFQEQVIKLAMVAADYQPGEADQLRRDMAAWGKGGRIDQHREKLISGMMAKGIKRKFAEQIFDQLRGFGEYGFPESHSASFAIIAYAASYLKCHYPAEFACSLLNSQPMGFYSPSTIIEDARRHGVEILPANVQLSQWDCTVEPCKKSIKGFALRIGLRYIKGLNKSDGKKLESVGSKVHSVQELSEKAGVSKTSLCKLAEAGALQNLTKNRRLALWDAHGIEDREMIFRPPAEKVEFSHLDAKQSNEWDYRSMGVSSSGHLLTYYRDQLDSKGLPTAKTVNALANETEITYVGIVICRQRPASASSVVFMTLEDETGYVNVILWPRCFERYLKLARSLVLMGVSGKLQVANNVVNLIAESIWDPGDIIPWKNFKSRDFH